VAAAASTARVMKLYMRYYLYFRRGKNFAREREERHQGWWGTTRRVESPKYTKPSEWYLTL
jgi:hypothetical protein